MKASRESAAPANGDAGNSGHGSASPGSASPGSADRDNADRDNAGWRGALPEVTIAAALVAAISATGYLLAGPAAAVTVILAATVLALAVLRGLVAAADPQPAAEAAEVAGRDPGVPGPAFSAFFGLSRWRAKFTDAEASMRAFEAGLGPQLQHLLAARLAERHGISLYGDPAAARRLLQESGAGELWQWAGPGRFPGPSGDQPGIPRRTLARLIKSLEQL